MPRRTTRLLVANQTNRQIVWADCVRKTEPNNHPAGLGVALELLEARPMKLTWFLFVLALSGCLEESVSTAQQYEKCDDCEGDGGGGDGLDEACATACTATADCNRTCRLADGSSTTCGAEKECQTCESACSPEAACGASCLDDGNVTTCESLDDKCMRYDTYCAYPIISGSELSDIHEGRINGDAYMYFASASGSKSGDYPQEIGGEPFDPTSAWASNFRGTLPIDGESARTQFEWPKPMQIGSFYPYKYGQTCVSVPTGSPRPTLPVKYDAIREDDECAWGFCNEDDFVGSFHMAREYCTLDVFAAGRATGWSEFYEATTAGSLKSLAYRMWCYSCVDTPTQACSEGVVP